MRRPLAPFDRNTLSTFLTLLAVLSVSAAGRLAAQEKTAESQARVPFIEGRPFAEVLKKAKAERKAIMVDAYAVWCGPCKLMDRTTFMDPEVIAWAKKNVIPVKVDAEKGEGRKISTRYRVNSFPTVLFLDSSGNEMDRLLGAHGAPGFRSYAELIVSGKSQLAQGIERVKKEWDEPTVLTLVQILTQRNDAARLKPLVSRLVREDSELAKSTTLDALLSLVAIEDYIDKMSPETVDLIVTYIPQLGNDPRRAVLGYALAHQQLREGDTKSARGTLNDTLKATGESTGNPMTSDLLALLGKVEQKAGKTADAISAFRRALTQAERASKPPSYLALRQLELAEVLALGNQAAEAQALQKKAAPAFGSDPGLYAKAARVSLALRSVPEALGAARKAVELTQGEDSEAQAALGASLAANGDQKGAQAALRRATELDPENAEIRREFQSLNRRSGTKAS